MLVHAKDYCSDRTRDGRVLVLMQGVTTQVDDSDTEMVAMVRTWIAQGFAEEPDTAAEPADEEPAKEPAPEPRKAAKAATTRSASTREAAK